jgi:hypothetical protein
MIPVKIQGEPANFDSTVRQPGRAFLKACPNPTSKDFKTHSFWKKTAQQLFSAYAGVCAYTCFYLVSPGTTDHFLPKSTYPLDAYEWQNYRLCSHRVNIHKGDSVEVIDPLIVQPGWFVLDIPSCLIKPGVGLSPLLTEQIQKTIDVLRLNDDDYFVQERCDLMVAFASGEVALPHLSKRYPFLAMEITRQGIQDSVITFFKGRHPS